MRFLLFFHPYTDDTARTVMHVVPDKIPPESPGEVYNSHTDDELIHLTLSGQTRAFDTLIRRHSRRLHMMLLQMLGSDADAYDVAQDAFLRAFHSLRYFNRKCTFYTWLYSIAANQVRNLLRKRKHDRSLSLNDEKNAPSTERNSVLVDSRPDADPIRGAYIADIKQHLRRAMARLSPAHREVVTLCDIMGLSYREVAQLLRISEGTLRSRIFYAHRELQTMLGDMVR